MSKKNDVKGTIEVNPVLWHDRKRFLGLPLSFTRYSVEEDRLITRIGFFRTEVNEVLLYRILDLKLRRTLGQKILGVGTITLYTADRTDSTLVLKNIKKPEQVRRFLSKIVEQRRDEKRVLGKEMYGTASERGCEHEHGHEFVDVDGDGIPD